MALQGLLQKGQSRCFVALFGNVAFQDLAFVIDRSPQIMALAIDLHKHLVNVPAPMPETPHSALTLATDFCRKQRPKPIPPKPHCFMADVDAALEQKILNVAQAEREP